MSVMRHRRTNATSLIVIVASSFVAQDPLVTAGESPGRAGIPSVDAWSFYHRRGAVFFASQQYSMPMSQSGVRRDKAALSSGCKSHPADAPAGSNRSSYGGNEVAEAFG